MGTPTDTWRAWSDFTEPGDLTRRVQTVDGILWSDGRILGDLSGALLNADDTGTEVFGGTVMGTFNPANKIYQTVTQGTSLPTWKFLEMVDATWPNPNWKLQQLNIPAVQLGVANLLQDPGTVNNLYDVYMNNVRFFAYSTGAPPRICSASLRSGPPFAARPGRDTRSHSPNPAA